VDFVLELFDETIEGANGDIIIPSHRERCKKVECNSFWRCLCEKGQKGKCKFTTLGSMSMTKASKLVKLLTGTNIKKLSGLDDNKVEQGRENFFKNIRTYIDKLFGPEESHTKELMMSKAFTKLTTYVRA
jgi:hypothetical protein